MSERTSDGTSHDSGSATWPWPPEVPRPQPPGRPVEPERPAPEPILPTWEEPLASPWGREITDRLLDERVVLVNGRLDDALAERTAQQLLLLGRRDPRRPVELHLSCGASELAASLSVAAAIDLAGAPVHATVSGSLSGPAVAGLCAAARRTAHRHATFVLSVPHTSDTGTPTTPVETRAEEHARMVAQVVDRVVAVTGQPAEPGGRGAPRGPGAVRRRGEGLRARRRRAVSVGPTTAAG